MASHGCSRKRPSYYVSFIKFFFAYSQNPKVPVKFNVSIFRNNSVVIAESSWPLIVYSISTFVKNSKQWFILKSFWGVWRLKLNVYYTKFHFIQSNESRKLFKQYEIRLFYDSFSLPQIRNFVVNHRMLLQNNNWEKPTVWRELWHYSKP